MNPVMFRLELDDPARAQEVTELIETRLAQLGVVDQAQADTEVVQEQGIETTVVVAAVTLTDGDMKPAIQTRRFISELEGIVGDLHGLQRVVLVVGDEQVGLEELTDKHLAKIVE